MLQSSEMLCAGEVKKDIADLLTNVPAIGDVFNVIDKIGAGNSHDIFVFFF